MPRAQALVVDADPDVRSTVRSILDPHTVELSETVSREDAEHRLRERSYDLLLVDLDDPSYEGLGSDAKRLPVGIGLGGTAGRAGLFDRLAKPVNRDALAAAIARALAHAAALGEIRRLRTVLRAGEEQLVGASAAIDALRSELERASSGRQPLWLVGETGTGKALAARLLHDRSHRAEHPFVTVHAATVTLADWPALLDQSQGGTLFLEDAGSLPAEVQTTILSEIPSRARLVFASVDEPRKLEERGDLVPQFRQLLAGSPLRLPPLRDRREDIPLLARHFVKSVADLNRMKPVILGASALERLAAHRWPGNVQELRNAMEHAVILAPDGEIRTHDLPESIQSTAPAAARVTSRQDLASRPFREVKREIVSDFERRYLGQLLERFSGNVTVAARHSGMLRSALQRLLRKHCLKSSEFRRRGSAERLESRIDSEARAD